MKSLAHTKDKESILKRLEQLQPNAQPRWGQMNANQMLCHLSDSFKSVMGEKAVKAKITLLQRTLIKWIALYFPVPWPKGVATMPENDQTIGGTKPTTFEADRRELEELIARFSARDRHLTWSSHPAMGPLSEKEWQRWGYLHVDHHLRQFGLVNC